jgi:hypothetical protein
MNLNNINEQTIKQKKPIKGPKPPVAPTMTIFSIFVSFKLVETCPSKLAREAMSTPAPASNDAIGGSKSTGSDSEGLLAVTTLPRCARCRAALTYHIQESLIITAAKSLTPAALNEGSNDL